MGDLAYIDAGIHNLINQLTELGYGDIYNINFENDIFLLHSFCGCDRDDCPWCMNCECPEEDNKYYVNGNIIFVTKWKNHLDMEGHNAVRVPVCEFCVKGRYPEKGAIPGKDAPNFWFKGNKCHKPLRVWWFKEIERVREVDRTVTPEEWDEIILLCEQSIHGHRRRKR